MKRLFFLWIVFLSPLLASEDVPVIFDGFPDDEIEKLIDGDKTFEQLSSELQRDLLLAIETPKVIEANLNHPDVKGIFRNMAIQTRHTSLKASLKALGVSLPFNEDEFRRAFRTNVLKLPLINCTTAVRKVAAPKREEPAGDAGSEFWDKAED